MRPPATPGQGLDRFHVDAVDVRPLLAVDFDIDEAGVHDGGHAGVLEGLVGHDVAPVAGGVADGQQDRNVSFLGRGEGFVAPGIPVDRIGGVLAQVRARLVRQAIGCRHRPKLLPRAPARRRSGPLLVAPPPPPDVRAAGEPPGRSRWSAASGSGRPGPRNGTARLRSWWSFPLPPWSGSGRRRSRHKAARTPTFGVRSCLSSGKARYQLIGPVMAPGVAKRMA